MSINDAYRQFNQERIRWMNLALTSAGWNPPNRLLMPDEPRPVLPTIEEDLPALRPLALKVVQRPAQSVKDVLAKLMTLTVMCPDLPEIHQAMAALFSNGNARRAISCLNSCLERKPGGSDCIASIKRELEARQ